MFAQCTPLSWDRIWDLEVKSTPQFSVDLLNQFGSVVGIVILLELAKILRKCLFHQVMLCNVLTEGKVKSTWTSLKVITADWEFTTRPAVLEIH